jgi:hypothetical protein
VSHLPAERTLFKKKKTMIQDDYFLKQIDILGRTLGKILANLLNLKSQGEIIEVIEITAQSLKSELDLNLNELLNTSNTNLIKFLQDDKKFNSDHLEKIAEILFELGSVVNNDIKINVLEKSLTIYDYLNHKSLTYSHDRLMKIEKIRTIL